VFGTFKGLESSLRNGADTEVLQVRAQRLQTCAAKRALAELIWTIKLCNFTWPQVVESTSKQADLSFRKFATLDVASQGYRHSRTIKVYYNLVGALEYCLKAEAIAEARFSFLSEESVDLQGRLPPSQSQ